MARLYAVKEVFMTLQGEGQWSGSAAVFCRFTGCNIWSGKEEHRERDSKKGVCAKWCDTDFVGTDGSHGGKYKVEELVKKFDELWAGDDGRKMVVFTGGEPSLQLDDELVDELRQAGWKSHVETNGYKPLPKRLDWVTLSPKPPLKPCKQRYDEVKVVYDGTTNTADPLEYYSFARNRYVQPLDGPEQEASLAACLAYVQQYSAWRLTLQTHKILGVP